jgi:hypothetical protein
MRGTIAVCDSCAKPSEQVRMYSFFPDELPSALCMRCLNRTVRLPLRLPRPEPARPTVRIEPPARPSKLPIVASIAVVIVSLLAGLAAR